MLRTDLREKDEKSRENAKNEICFTQAAKDFYRLTEALAEDSPDSDVYLALFERSLATAPIGDDVKKSLFREVNRIKISRSGDFSAKYDCSWMEIVSKEGFERVGEYIPKISDEDEEQDNGFSPFAAPAGKGYAISHSRRIIRAQVPLKEGKSSLGGGAYLFYCANAYCLMSAYDLKFDSFFCLPISRQDKTGGVSAAEADIAAREFLVTCAGISSAAGSRSVLSEHFVLCGTVYLRYISGSLSCTVGVDEESGKVILYFSEKM